MNVWCPGAFQASLERWVESGKMIPVLADHDGKIGSVVGRIDPRMSAESNGGLIVAGHLDTESELGARVYELVKGGARSWSIGYTIPEGGRRKAGRVTELAQIDLAEISVVATPANEGTRTLSIKSEPSVQIVSFEC